ncbi:GntR family transcriptional regulator [Streptomyces sp. ERV7]|uniref:GntR family transcriptional regulator n=1 Tax=Streptomyces sp. ERV7 TaxID=1322334 RepID=UPI0007F3DB37|nr:GntR family transcriptional regulator [Streptomyces sp. ERV7]OAR24787.1 GntR family transcriptional regulator [Streptomyces sp. ERV7]
MANEDRTPASQRIAAELRDAIDVGTYAPGARLPSTRTLAERYGVVRNTIDEALKILQQQGVITVEWGRGAFVRERTRLIRLGSDRYSPKYRESGLSPFLIECAKQGKTGRFEVLSVGKAKPDAGVADRLSLSPSRESALRRENVFYADDVPVYRVTTWIPWDVAQGTGLLEAEVPHQYGIHGVLEEQGHTMARINDEISARMPNPDEARYLALPPGVPVIEVVHTSIDQQGSAYEVTSFVMRADMNGLAYNVPVE